MSISRTYKRLIIIAVYLLIFLGIAMTILMFILPDSTCYDGRQNQNETAIDCGGVCGACPENIVAKDLIIENTTLIYSKPNTYDIVANVKNPNGLYGAAKVYYTFSLMREDGTVIIDKKDIGFILPTQQRYFMTFGLFSATPPASARFTIDHVEWISFTGFQDPDFMITNKRFGPLSDSISYARAFGIVQNNSPYDFVEAVAYVIIRDERGTPIAINRTTINNFESSLEREFRLDWPTRFPGTITSADFEVYANVFDSQNFVKKFLPQGGFEQTEF